MPMRADSELTWDHSSSSSSSVGGLANPFSLFPSLHFTGARRFSPSILPPAVVGPVCHHWPRRRRPSPTVRSPAFLVPPPRPPLASGGREETQERRASERASALTYVHKNACPAAAAAAPAAAAAKAKARDGRPTEAAAFGSGSS